MPFKGLWSGFFNGLLLQLCLTSSEGRNCVCLKAHGGQSESVFSYDLWLLKETMETMETMEPLAMKGLKARKETKETWGLEGSGGSMAPKERRATQECHQNCR